MPSQDTIQFLSDGISFDLEDQKNVQEWILNAVKQEGMSIGEISYIFCSDNYLHKINMKHLQHDTFTDIITFDYSVDNIINSDIFISIDRVKENAMTFGVAFNNELSRVIIHGILHLLGYKDKSDPEKEIMRSKEDFYLSLLPN